MSGWILVVEDDLDGRELLAELLADMGYEVVACATAAEAEAALSQRAKPCVALTDLSLQDSPGSELVARMRARPGFEYVPAIFVTGVEPSLLEEIRDPVLRKPVDVDRLLELVAQHCTSTTD
ncbi:MAG: response regulator [Polyangia bacterium]|jgi:CheY-like chemotaxis protein